MSLVPIPSLRAVFAWCQQTLINIVSSLAKDSRWLAECALYLKRQVLPSVRTPNWHEHLHHFMLPQDACDTPSTVMKLFEMFAKPNKGLIDRNAVTMMQSQ